MSTTEPAIANPRFDAYWQQWWTAYLAGRGKRWQDLPEGEVAEMTPLVYAEYAQTQQPVWTTRRSRHITAQPGFDDLLSCGPLQNDPQVASDNFAVLFWCARVFIYWPACFFLAGIPYLLRKLLFRSKVERTTQD